MQVLRTVTPYPTLDGSASGAAASHACDLQGAAINKPDLPDAEAVFLLTEKDGPHDSLGSQSHTLIARSEMNRVSTDTT
jgi:hypothetical protein